MTFQRQALLTSTIWRTWNCNITIVVSFETAHIRLECPYRFNQKAWKPTFIPFAKARKRIETLFSQLTEQFLIIRNYAKITNGLFASIIGKISALTVLQYAMSYRQNFCSAIVRISSEPVEISSELVWNSSELVLRISELLSFPDLARQFFLL